MIQPFGGKVPRIHPTAFVHPLAYVAGDVIIDEYATVWPFASVRAERSSIHIGAYSNVQDNCTLHADPGEPMEIQPYVTIGHGVTFHGLRIGEHTLLGMGATAVQLVDIGAWCLIGAGAVLSNGFTVPDRSLVLGIPARVVGPVQDRHIDRLERAGKSYVDLGQRYLTLEGGTPARYGDEAS